jgi:hypothetical protein
MKVYEVECRAVIMVSEQDLEKAALHAAALFKDNPDLVYVRAVQEMRSEPTWEDPSPNQKKDRPERSGSLGPGGRHRILDTDGNSAVWSLR